MSNRWALILWAATVVAVLVFLYYVRSVLFPFAASVFLAVLLNPLVTSLQKNRGFSATTAVGLIYLTFFLIITAGFFWLWNPITEQAQQLTRTAPTAFEKGQQSIRNFLLAHSDWLAKYKILRPAEPDEQTPPATDLTHSASDSTPIEEHAPPKLRMETDSEVVDRLMNEYVEQISTRVQQIGPSLISGVLSRGVGVLTQLLNLILIPLLTFFLLADRDKMLSQAALLIPKQFRTQILGVFEDIGVVFLNYVRGLFISGVIFGATMMILFTLFGVPNSLVLGLLAGLMYFIPYVGITITIIVAVASAALAPAPHALLFFIYINDTTMYAVIVLIVCIVANFIYDQMTTPRIVGGAVGLHPVFAIFALMTGATLFGIFGMLLAFPIAGSIKVILGRLIRIMKLGEPVQEPPTEIPQTI